MSERQTAFEIRLVPQDGNELDNDWQEDCRRVVERWNRDVEDLDAEIEPSELPRTGPGARSVSALSFASLSVLLLETGVVKDVAGRLFDRLNGWMQSRKGCSCVIRTPDGSEFKLEHLSKDEVMKLMAQTRAASPDG